VTAVDRNNTQTCHAVGCDVVVPYGRLLCLRHWRMLPASLHSKVNRAYRRWLGDKLDHDRIEVLRAVQKEAIAAVARAEGLPAEVVG